MMTVILAIVLALPALLFQLISAPIVFILMLPSILLLLFRKEGNDESGRLPDHVVITGGSSGIGLGIAKECMMRKIPKITIIARNQERLDSAKATLEGLATTKTTTIKCFAADVSNPDAMEKIAKEECNLSEKTIIFCNAGIFYTKYYQETQTSEYIQMTQINQLGVIFTARAFLPYLTEGKGGTIVITSSAAGQVGMFGCTSYAPSKFALRGFAEALHMELCAVPNVHVQMAFPADVDTPGYREELKEISPECKALNESGGLGDAESTAKTMVNAAFQPNPDFCVYFSPVTWMLSNATAGMSPVSNLTDAATQIALGGVLRFTSMCFLGSFWHTIRDMKKKKIKTA